MTGSASMIWSQTPDRRNERSDCNKWREDHRSPAGRPSCNAADASVFQRNCFGGIVMAAYVIFDVDTASIPTASANARRFIRSLLLS